MNKVINLAAFIFILVAVFIWPPRCNIDSIDAVLAIKLISGDIEAVKRRIHRRPQRRNDTEASDDNVW